MNVANVHNLLDSRFILGGINYVSTFVRPENVYCELSKFMDSATYTGAVHFALGVTIAAEDAGYIGPCEAFDILDHLCARLAA